MTTHRNTCCNERPDPIAALIDKIIMEELAQFNQHQQDARGRLDTLAKAIFLLAGGTLTLSINSFTGKNSTPLNAELVPYIKSSWGFLFYSMVSFLIVIALVLLSMYVFGERWRKQIDGGQRASQLKIEPIQFFFVGSGLVSFVIGFGLMAYVAIGMVGT